MASVGSTLLSPNQCAEAVNQVIAEQSLISRHSDNNAAFGCEPNGSDKYLGVKLNHDDLHNTHTHRA